LVIKKKYG